MHAYQLPYSVQWDSVLPVPSQGQKHREAETHKTHKQTHKTQTQTHTSSGAGMTTPAWGVVGMAVMAVIIVITQRRGS